jgi:hypothetical protein
MAYVFNPFTGTLDNTGATQTQYYAEPVVTNDGNTDVIYQTGSPVVPDFVYANDGSFVFSLIPL